VLSVTETSIGVKTPPVTVPTFVRQLMTLAPTPEARLSSIATLPSAAVTSGSVSVAFRPSGWTETQRLASA
jgi:hypothetical protein